VSLDLSDDQLRAIARQRTAAHAGTATQRVWHPLHDLMGVVSEYAFARAFGRPFQATCGRQGDGRQDNGLWVGRLSVDVKASPTPYRLLRAVATPHADILVLARFTETPLAAELLGWEFDAVLQKCPVDIRLRVPCHVRWARDLRPMQELHDWFDALRSKRRP
jgi:hypothetical protein